MSMIADGPFAQYQCTEATKEDTLALVLSLNRVLPTSHNDELIRGNFGKQVAGFETNYTEF